MFDFEELERELREVFDMMKEGGYCYNCYLEGEWIISVEDWRNYCKIWYNIGSWKDKKYWHKDWKVEGVIGEIVKEMVSC